MTDSDEQEAEQEDRQDHIDVGQPLDPFADTRQRGEGRCPHDEQERNNNADKVHGARNAVAAGIYSTFWMNKAPNADACQTSYKLVHTKAKRLGDAQNGRNHGHDIDDMTDRP